MAAKNNILSISKHTGYSTSTVSRVLSGKAGQYRISEAAVQIITREAEKCHYRPNLVAQTLRTQKSQTIGLLIPGIDNPFFASLAGIIIGFLRERGYHTLLADSRENEREEEEALYMFISRHVDGIISVPVSSFPALHEKLSTEVPIVLIDRYFNNTSLPYICTDNYAGARMATEFLLKNGYRNILAIQGVPSSMPNKERVRGFCDVLKENGAAYSVRGDAFSVENGRRETLAAFANDSRHFDAVFAFSSTILLGTINALRQLGLRPAKDLGLISYDNNGFLDFLDPAVTRIEQPLKEAGETAVEILFNIMEARSKGLPEPKALQQLIKPTLVVRSSC